MVQDRHPRTDRHRSDQAVGQRTNSRSTYERSRPHARTPDRRRQQAHRSTSHPPARSRIGPASALNWRSWWSSRAPARISTATTSVVWSTASTSSRRRTARCVGLPVPGRNQIQAEVSTSVTPQVGLDAAHQARRSHRAPPSRGSRLESWPLRPVAAARGRRPPAWGGTGSSALPRQRAVVDLDVRTSHDTAIHQGDTTDLWTRPPFTNRH